ncbi:MAG: O-antigen polymerase [Thermoleophilia bacterium]|nr:O-antigen polymerase [Thermoleophilia bacterium]
MNGSELLTNAAAIVASIGGIACMLMHRTARMVGIMLLLLGWVGLLFGIAPASALDDKVLLLAGSVAAADAAWIVAGRLVGRESWIMALGAIVLVMRVPVPTGDGTAMLLAPLYAVIGLGAIVLLRSELRTRGTKSKAAAPAPRVPADRGGATRLLDIGVATLPIIAALSLTWSIDRAQSAETITFFLVPFLLAYVLVRSWLSAGVSLVPAARGLVVLACIVAAVGLVQVSISEVWWNAKVIDANQFRPDFRTNSLFWDPNIYGRALVVGMVAIIAGLLVRPIGGVRLTAALATLVGLTTALWFTYSQSSWIALGGALAVLGVLTLPVRPRRWVALGLAVLLIVALPLADRALSGREADSRRDVVRDGIALAAEKPLLGWGIGTFETAARERALEQGDGRVGLTASHTTPITIMAEVGVLGTMAYLLLLGSAAAAALARWRRATRDARPFGWPVPPVIWATATVVALFAHSLLYAGFFEDATLWVALAVLASLPRVSDAAPEAVPEAVPVS